MDLTCDVPRSPYDKLGGIVFLPRSIDKGRADLAGTLGEYVARTGRSARLFEFPGRLGRRLHRSAARPSDGRGRLGLGGRAHDAADARGDCRIQPADVGREPEDEGDRWTWAEFREFLADCGQAHRTDITRHFDRLDLDEGRDVPMGGRQLC